MMEQTTYLNEESGRKQVTMPYWAYLWLKEDDEGTMTKGLKAYEALLFKFGEYEDSLSEIENSVNSRLSSIGGEELLTSILKIKNSQEVLDYENDDRADHVNIHLPESLIEQLTVQRGIGDHIAEAVEEIAQSIYDDRMDRIQVKQQIADFIEHGNEPTHEVARAIVDGEGDIFREAHNQVLEYTDGEVEYEELQVRDDLTLEELEEVEHTGDGQGWSQFDGAERREGLETAVRNEIQKEDVDEYKYNEEELINLAEDIFNVGEATAKTYVGDIDIDWIDTVMFDPKAIAQARKRDAKSELNIERSSSDRSIANKIDRMPVSDFVLIDMEEIPQGGEIPVEKAQKMAEEILEHKSYRLLDSKIGGIQKAAHKEFIRKIKLISEIDE